ncbi:hypothetical protein R8Z50_16955 [Longispora sp. K20-0274]|uniref:hypothetical protein n=1 Tax=Longispora sp. K20-0274 TaxID=3088255 RepID=UPI00399B9C04
MLSPSTPPVLRRLLPAGGLRRGSTVSVTGSLTLLLALLAEAASAGARVTAVGMPAIVGLVPGEVATLPDPGPGWPRVVAELLHARGSVVVLPAGAVTARDAEQLAALARQCGSVLVCHGPAWAAADVRLEETPGSWPPFRDGRELGVQVRGRGKASRPVRALLRLPLRHPVRAVA